MTEQDITILAYTDTGTFFGILAIPAGMRLFDFINLSAQFIHLTGREIIEDNDDLSNLSEIHVNKKAINILTTVLDDESRGSYIKDKLYQFIQKKPASVKIYMNKYEIRGNLHITDEGTVSQILEKDLMFLPCTEAIIHNLSTGKTKNSSFAALNKDSISVLEQVK